MVSHIGEANSLCLEASHSMKSYPKHKSLTTEKQLKQYRSLLQPLRNIHEMWKNLQSSFSSSPATIPNTNKSLPTRSLRAPFSPALLCSLPALPERLFIVEIKLGSLVPISPIMFSSSAQQRKARELSQFHIVFLSGNRYQSLPPLLFWHWLPDPGTPSSNPTLSWWSSCYWFNTWTHLRLCSMLQQVPHITNVMRL